MTHRRPRFFSCWTCSGGSGGGDQSDPVISPSTSSTTYSYHFTRKTSHDKHSVHETSMDAKEYMCAAIASRDVLRLWCSDTPKRKDHPKIDLKANDEIFQICKLWKGKKDFWTKWVDTTITLKNFFLFYFNWPLTCIERNSKFQSLLW